MRLSFKIVKGRGIKPDKDGYDTVRRYLSKLKGDKVLEVGCNGTPPATVANRIRQALYKEARAEGKYLRTKTGRGKVFVWVDTEPYRGRQGTWGSNRQEVSIG